MTPTELHLKYRPKELSEVVGQPEAVKILQDKLEKNSLPHCILFSGPSGVGKTTIARILKDKLDCKDFDFHEINAASSRGIDTIREIEERLNCAPMGGKCRIFLLDECHQLTQKKGGDAQTAMLKMLEDTPSHVYFFLATTHPEQLLKTIHTRCTHIKLKPLSERDMRVLLSSVLVREEGGLASSISDEVFNRILEAGEGSARQALVTLGEVLSLKTEEEQLRVIDSVSLKKVPYDLFKALIYSRAKWGEICKILENLEAGDDVLEGLRRYILGATSTEMLKNKATSARCYLVINAFESSWFYSGKAGLLRACYEVCLEK